MCWAVTQSSRTTAARTCWCTTAYCWIVAAWPLFRLRSRRSRCQLAYRCRIWRWSGSMRVARVPLTNRSRRAICSSRGGSVPVATSTLRRCARIGVWSRPSSSPWVSWRRPAAMSASTAATGCLASQRSAVPGGSVAVRAAFSEASDGQIPPSGLVSSSRSRSSRRQPGHWPGRGRASQAGQWGKAGTVQSRQRGSSSVPDAMGLTWPQLPHRAGRSWQGGHHGSPVSREVPQGRCSPQTEQVSAGAGSRGTAARAGCGCSRRGGGRSSRRLQGWLGR